jgi:type II secretory pathway component PulF
MPLCRYTAVDASGQKLVGEVDALTVDEAQRRLQVQGLSAVDLTLESPPSASPVAPGGGVGDPAAVAEAVSVALSSGLPLAAGLRALSAEAGSSRLQSTLRDLSDRVAAGESLDAAITHANGRLSPTLAAVLRAGQRSGRLPLALTRYVDLARESREQRRNLWVGLIYPLALLAGCALILTLLVGFVVPMFAEMFDDFAIELPAATAFVVTASRFVRQYWGWMLVALAAPVISGAVVLRAGVSPAVRSLLLDQIPVYGWMRRNFALARFCRMLAILVDGQTPFPEALRLAGAAASAGIQSGSERLADDIEAGLAPEEAARRILIFPRWIVPLLRWHDRGPAFSEALEGAANLCISRSEAQLTLAVLIAEPAIIVSIALTIGFTIICLFLPTFTLLNELS